MGEFGAVSVISGNIVGKTQTLTLFVESAYKVQQWRGLVLWEKGSVHGFRCSADEMTWCIILAPYGMLNVGAQYCFFKEMTWLHALHAVLGIQHSRGVFSGASSLSVGFVHPSDQGEHSLAFSCYRFFPLDSQSFNPSALSIHKYLTVCWFFGPSGGHCEKLQIQFSDLTRAFSFHACCHFFIKKIGWLNCVLKSLRQGWRMNVQSSYRSDRPMITVSVVTRGWLGTVRWRKPNEGSTVALTELAA